MIQVHAAFFVSIWMIIAVEFWRRGDYPGHTTFIAGTFFAAVYASIAIELLIFSLKDLLS